MSEKTEALRLAAMMRHNAAAELRRLRAEVERLSCPTAPCAESQRPTQPRDSIHTCHSECQRPLCKLTRERDALLEALRTLLSYAFTLEMRLDADGEHRAMQQARAAIKAVEEST